MKPVLLLLTALWAVSAAAQPRVDAARLMADLTYLADDARGGRLPETPGGREARAFIERRFRALGLTPFEGGYVRPFAFTGRDTTTRLGANVAGFVRGTVHPDSFIVVTAHFDHVGTREGEIYNGADDNASGTAGLMALAAHFAAHPPRHTLVFVALDAEEQGLRGARAFVAEPPVPLAQIMLNVNLDMIARGDRGELYAAGTHYTPRFRPVLERASAGVAGVTLRFGHDSPDLPPQDNWTMQSDHGAFHVAGVPFLYFGVEDHPDYHRPTDDADRINPAFYAAAVELILRAVEALDGTR
jgi:Zn-dependent M28 family amino/carboxypeptidase